MPEEVVLVPNDEIKQHLDALISGKVSIAEWRQTASFETHAWTIHNSNDFARIIWGRSYAVAGADK